MNKNMFKKGGIALGITGTTLITLAAPAYADFVDVPKTSPYYDSVTWLEDNNLVSGYSDGTFRSDRTITKKEFFVLLVRTERVDVSKNWWAPFNDVSENSSYRQLIAWAYSKGLVTKNTDGTVGLNKPITKAFAANVFYKLNGSPSVSGLPRQFNDVGSTYSLYNAIQWGKSVGILEGNSSNNFRPNTYLTRGETAKMMQNSSSLLAISKGDFFKRFTTGEKVDISNNWWAPFNDVPVDSIYRKPMAWAYKNGMVSKDANGNVGIYSTMSNADVARTLYKFRNSPDIASTTPQQFTDVTSSNPDYKAIQWAKLSGIMTGTPEGKFYPNAPFMSADMEALIKSTFDQGLVPDTFLGREYPPEVMSAAEQSALKFKSMTVPSQAEMKQIIIDTAKSMGVDPYLALGHAYTESALKQNSVSPANALGAMQVMPTSGEWVAAMTGKDIDLYDAYDNVFAGVYIIRWMHQQESNYDYAIGGYYQGLNGVRRDGPRPDTLTYIQKVKTNTDLFRTGKL